MPDFLTLTCPTCGAKLKLADKINLLVCASCGNEHMVTRDGGAIYLAPMAADMRQMRVGVDKTAAELAVVRLGKELADLEASLAQLNERRRKNNNESGCLWSVGIVVELILIIQMYNLFAAADYAVSVGCAILFLGLLAVMIANATKRTKSQVDEDSERTEAAIKNRRTQLAKNRQIAES